MVCGFGFSTTAVVSVVLVFFFPELRCFSQVYVYELGMSPAVVGAGSIAGEYFLGLLCLAIAIIPAIASAFALIFRIMCSLCFRGGFGLEGNVAVGLRDVFRNCCALEEVGHISVFLHRPVSDVRDSLGDLVSRPRFSTGAKCLLRAVLFKARVLF